MGTDRLVYIRTDGNTKIAAGHLVRCLSIAESCLSQGMRVCFLVSDKESAQLLSGFFTEDLKENPRMHIHTLVTAAYDNLEQELSEVIYQMLDTPGAVYLLDSYFVTEKYITILNSYVKIAYLDDLMLDYPADLVINYDVIPDDTKAMDTIADKEASFLTMRNYIQTYQKAKKVLLGTAYTPLRHQFQNNAVTMKESITDVLVTTGGSDPYHFCVEFLKAYAKCMTTPSASFISPATDCDVSFPLHTANIPTLHIVIGKLSTDAQLLHTLAAQHPFVILHENVTDMASLMSQCDLAVSAAGTTLYELCALGVPAISFTMADNQLTSAKAFHIVKAIPCAGDIRADLSAVIDRTLHFLSQMNDISKRKNAHQTMRSLVDGNGAMRIAEELFVI